MNKIYFLLIAVLGYLPLAAQQDAQYTQFMFNKLAYNPGYAGSADVPCAMVLYRNQWVGLEGAPKTQVLSFHSPFRNDRTAIGTSIIRDKIGPTESTYFSLAYSYRIRMKKGTLGLGLQGLIRNYRVRWEELEGGQVGDDLIATADGSKVLPNIGVGAYYETDKFYLGISVPHLVQGDVSLLNEDVAGTTINAKESIHAYLMTGFIFDVSRSVKFKPALLIKVVENTPFDMDFNGSFLFSEKILLGMSYRLGGSSKIGFGESIDFVAQYFINNSVRVGAAYDITLSELRGFSTGSFELLLQYCFYKKNERFTNPRFF